MHVFFAWVTKLSNEFTLQVTGQRYIDKQILKALKEKNIRTAYYWSASYWMDCHKHYRKDIQKTLDNTEHIVIENNMVTLDEVTDTIQSVMRCLDLDDTLPTDVQTEIKPIEAKLTAKSLDDIKGESTILRLMQIFASWANIC